MGVNPQEIAQMMRRIADLERLVKQLLAPKSKARIINGAADLRFFELIEDMPGGHGEKAWAKFLDWENNTLSEGWIFNWGQSTDGIIGYFPAGFYGTCGIVNGQLAFNQAECGQRCVTGTYIPEQTPTDAELGQEDYSYTVSVTGTIIAASFAASGLPTGWAISATTGIITGPTTAPGVEGPLGEFDVIVTASARNDEDTGDCTVTRRLVFNVVDTSGDGPGEEDPGEEEVPP